MSMYTCQQEQKLLEYGIHANRQQVLQYVYMHKVSDAHVHYMCVPYTCALYVRLVCAGPTIEAAELDSKQFRAARGKEEDRETLSLR